MIARTTAPLRRVRLPTCDLETFLIRAGCAAVALGGLLAPSAVSADEAWASRFRIYTPEPGVYRVGYDELRQAGLAAEAWPVAQLDLRNQGSRVALWVEDDGDGRFGPGDWFEFVARQLSGGESFAHEYSTENVYRLGLNPEGGSRMSVGRIHPAGGGDATVAGWRRRVHLEWDRLLVRLSSAQVEGVEWPEIWFWEKLTHLDREGLTLPLDLPGLVASDSERVEIAVHMRALSSQPEKTRSELPDHRVNFELGDRSLGRAEWDGRQRHLARLEGVPASALESAAPSPAPALSMRIPRRRPEGSEDALVDVVMLNWVEYDYPHDGLVGDQQLELRPASPGAGRLALQSTTGSGLMVYGDSGTRFELPASKKGGLEKAGGTLEGRLDDSYWIAPRGANFSPSRIENDHPSRLASTQQQADYLILAHGTLLESASPAGRSPSQRRPRGRPDRHPGCLRRVRLRHRPPAGDQVVHCSRVQQLARAAAALRVAGGGCELGYQERHGG